MNSVVVRALLVRGMLAGIAAGLLAFGLAYVIGEPPLIGALAYETAHATGHETELVSRRVQSTAGLATGVLIFGTALGGMASLVFCFALGRIGRMGARATAGLVALGAFFTVFLVPFLKYPANPPAVSNPDTLGQRTGVYFLMIAISVLLGVAAVQLGRQLAPRLGGWNATVTAATLFVSMTVLAAVLLPAVKEMPPDFPANVVWRFRLAAVGIQAAMWASFGLLFGYLAERTLQPHIASDSPAGAPVSV